MREPKKPLSLYVHIPFCVRKCLYCDFLSGSATEKEKEEYVQLLSREIASWGQMLRGEYRLETIFLGGGTPSCLSPEQLKHLGKVIREGFSLGEHLEYTTEANPGTITECHIQAWKEMGVNRISLGLQSARNEELKRLGRIHTYEEFLASYQMILDAGFQNINIDLMADIPGQTLESYRDTLEKVTALKPGHISAYSLIVEPGTPFFELEQQGLLKRENEETDREMYELTRTFLQKYGYERYEISNYARPGQECRHNCVYWQGGEYLGVGLGASSYLQHCRFSNQTEMPEYREYVIAMEHSVTFELAGMSEYRENVTVAEHNVDSETENERKAGWKGWQFQEFATLDTRMQMEEFMFLGLRMQKGVSRTQFQKQFGIEMEEVYGKVLSGLFRDKLLAETDFHDRIYLTNRGIDLSNRVLAEFLLEE